MKPTQEQLNDPAWWEQAKDGFDYCYYIKDESDYAFTEGIFESAGFELLAKRPTKAAFVPEVGVECEGFTTDLAGLWKWRKVEPLKETTAGEFACLVAGRSLRFVDQFRPIKSERDLFVEAAQLAADTTQSTVFGKLYDAGCRFVETDK